MNNPNLPGKSSNFPDHDPDDIPEALRETPKALSSTSKFVFPWVWGSICAGAIALLAAVLGVWQLQGASRADSVTATPVTPAKPGIRDALGNIGIQFPDTLLGHRPYEEVSEDILVSVTADGRVKLRESAAEQFLAMADAARAEDIYLVALSGFRSIDYQKYLFFGIKAEEGQATTHRAETSAPPGYSEHHTGYAIDIGDATRPETDVQPDFGDTPAFRWLEEHAAYYSFELSFPKNNSDGVSYEPWHWRFVGDTESLELFYGSPDSASSLANPDQ
ncbi:MAG TPA: M15 family metallopeptidase [Elainellaceae cyanobacterium]